jgi:segregation and condensation protein B
VSDDERPESLARQAASWVPPWERQQRPPDRRFQAEAEAEAEDELTAQPGLSGELPGDDQPGGELSGDDRPGGELSGDDRPDDDQPDDDEDRSEAGLSEDDDDFDEAFEGTNPPGYLEQESDESEMSGSADESTDALAGDTDALAGDADALAGGADALAGDTDALAGGERDGDRADELPPVDRPVGDEPLAPVAGAVPEQGRRTRDIPVVVAPSTRTSEDLPELVDDSELCAALEAILLVVDEPVAEMQLAQILEQPTERVAAMLEDISARYTAAGHGFDLRRAAGGWRLYTRPEYAAYVERFVLDGQSVRLTQAALETLAVVAYKQPVTRSRISAIRGVNCDGVMRTLATRGLIEECGVEGETGGSLYRTTPLFLEKLGINSVDQLPPLAPFLPDDVEEVLDAPG